MHHFIDGLDEPGRGGGLRHERKSANGRAALGRDNDARAEESADQNDFDHFSDAPRIAEADRPNHPQMRWTVAASDG